MSEAELIQVGVVVAASLFIGFMFGEEAYWLSVAMGPAFAAAAYAFYFSQGRHFGWDDAMTVALISIGGSRVGMIVRRLRG